MILFFYIILNIVAIYIMRRRKKVLFSLETLVYWMVATYVYQNFSAFCYMNFQTLYIPENLILELSHFINRIGLFPILMVIFLDYILIFKTFFKKGLLMIGFILLFVGLEWLADFLGVLNHENWKLWWSFAYWVSALGFMVGFMKLFRKVLYKKGGLL